MFTRSTRAEASGERAFALLAGAMLLLSAACTNAGPVVAPAAEVAKQAVAPAAAVSLPADNPPSPGGTIHWLGSTSAPVTLEEYGDFQ